MAESASRLAKQLVGGLLVGALGAIAWIARRQKAPCSELPPSATPPPPTPVEPTDAPAAQPATLPTTARPGVRAFLVAAVGIAIAIAGAVALTPVAGAGAWRLPLAIAVGVLLLAGAVFVLPHLLAPPQNLTGVQGLSPKDRIQFADDRRKLQNDIRTSMLQAVAGGAVLVGVLFTWQQQQSTSQQIADQLAVTRQGQVGERFSRAVDQLGSNNIDVRLGGLYELEQLARQAPERRRVIIEVVAAFIRQHARPPGNISGQQTYRPPQDVAAALTILSRSPIQAGDPKVSLQGANLRRANLFAADLDHMDLSGVGLGGALLAGARLGDVFLVGTDLRDAELVEADLRRAVLIRARVGGASFRGADLRGAFFDGVSLRGAFFQGADLRGADLRGADLRGAFLNGARADRFTRWPDSFDWRRAGIEQVE